MKNCLFPLCVALLIGGSCLPSNQQASSMEEPSNPSSGALPQVTQGRIERIEKFPSQEVTARHVDVWLPEGYPEAGPYAVLYMHDGQMLYDAASTWNQQAWEVDEVAAQLQAKGTVPPFIVVGVWNGGDTRHADYFPQRPFEQLTAAERDTVVAQLQRAGRTKEVFTPQSDAYLRFLVEELKPHIDSSFAVHTDRAHTFVVGSSMGGLISMYALCEYPEVFGAAACLSTHWVGTFTLENNPMPQAFIGYLQQSLPDPAQHRLYFDCGDQTLDALYPDLQRQVDQVMQAQGYDTSQWLTRYFPGEDHSEAAWSARLTVPLKFLFLGDQFNQR